MQTPIGYNGKIHPCYTFYLRAHECVNTESLVKIMCNDKLNDYKECKSNSKKLAYKSWYEQEYKKLKILSMPKYDDATDSFVDGNPASTADSFFNNETKMNKLFNIGIPTVGSHSNSNGHGHGNSSHS
jgi:hypothetical protein